MEISGKNISIIGAVKSGIGAAKLIRELWRYSLLLVITVRRKIERFNFSIERINIDFEIGNHSDRVFDCELMVVSPGVPSNAEVFVESPGKKNKVNK